MALIPMREPGEYVFQAFRGSGPASRHSVKNVLNKACKALGIDTTKVDVHSFRRTWVTDAVRNPDLAVAEAMRHSGHETLSVFMDYERNYTGDDLKDIAQKVHQHRRGRIAKPSSPSPGRIGVGRRL